MKEYVIDFITGTIVAAVLTLISYIVGFDKTWDDAAQLSLPVVQASLEVMWCAFS